MRGTFFSRYEEHLQKIDDRYNLDLDLRNYEAFAERNIRLRDLPSAANAISIAGLALVIDGCKDLSKVNNVHKIAAGRGLDLFDGSVARFLDQSTDMGAIVDVTCDKLGMAAIAKAAWQQDALPKPFITYIYAKNLTHAGLTVAAGYNHPNDSFRPPTSGKHAMFGDNLGGGLLMYANAYEHEHPELGTHKKLRRTGNAIIAASIIPEATALKTYIKRVLT